MAKCIKADNLPPKLPLWPSLLMFLVLERFDAAGWVWGAVGLLFALWWGGALYALFTAQPIDILKDHK